MALRLTKDEPTCVVGIVGGAVAGSEAAAEVVRRGGVALVFEQGERPYGKIEDGLPRWHEKLRKQEYKRIDENLSLDGVHFVPKTRIGGDVTVDALRDAGLSALILANGAWRDRPLPIDGVDAYEGKGLVYQNPFVYWFNHKHEPGYDGPAFEVHGGSLVVGGGLASVDVIKILQLELYARALGERGHHVDVVEMEIKGIPRTCEALGVDHTTLGVEDCTLVYRRRREDMPLAQPNGTDEAAMAKVQKARTKIMERLERKYLIKFEGLASPIGAVVEGDALVGLRFQRNRPAGGRKLEAVPDGEFEILSPMIISSIGSIPAPIEGLPTKGELFDFADWDTGEVRDRPGVFGLGNVLTGKGNIRDSRANSLEVSASVASSYLGIGDEVDGDPLAAVRERAKAVADQAFAGERLAAADASKLESIVSQCWDAADYGGDYAAWIDAHAPVD